MENSITVRSQLVPTENEFQTLKTMAQMAVVSGLYQGVGSEAKIMMVLLAARELGISPMIALNGGIWNIQGKIEISARLMNSMIRRAGHSISIKHSDSTKCIIEGKRVDNGDTCIAQFTIEDARAAGISNRSTWKTYAEDMLYSRAMSRLARRLFPDVIGSAYVEGEIRDVKCEIVESIQEEQIEEDEETTKAKFSELLADYPEEKWPLIQSYLDKYSTYWKKTLYQSLIDYQDREKFKKDFTKWEVKQGK
jgi:hypothetical protein